MNTDYQRLAAAARELKDCANQADLARLLNMSEQRLNNWSRRGIPRKEINYISRIIGCSPYWLENGEGEMQFDYTLITQDGKTHHIEVKKFNAAEPSKEYSESLQSMVVEYLSNLDTDDMDVWIATIRAAANKSRRKRQEENSKAPEPNTLAPPSGSRRAA